MSLEKPVILCVDDEESILKSLTRLFRKSNVILRTTTNPMEALEIIQKEKVDLIISDYRMKEMTGLDLLKRAKTVLPNTPRLILSGFADEKLIEDALKTGDVDEYLLKPFESNDLVKIVSVYLFAA